MNSDEVIFGGKGIEVMGKFSKLILGKKVLLYMELRIKGILKVLRELREGKVYRGLRKYPSVYGDLVMMVDMGVMRESSKYLMGIEVMDIYMGKHLPMGKKSLGYRLIFGDDDGALDNRVVNGDYDGLVEGLRKGCVGEMGADMKGLEWSLEWRGFIEI